MILNTIIIMTLIEIKNSLSRIEEFTIKDAIDNSHIHSNHIAMVGKKNVLTHLEIHISLNVKPISKLLAHRIIFKNLNNFIKKGLHSVEIKIIK